MVGIYVFSTLLGESASETPVLLYWRVSDPVASFLHLTGYAGLAWLWCRYLQARSVGPWASAVIAATVSIGYGLLMEWAQYSTPGRSAQLSDAALNSVGALIGVWTASRFRRTQRTRVI